MSTDIKNIKGLVESSLNTKRIDTEMNITRFWGGPKKGTMLQLTIRNGDGYIQLTKKQCKKLSKLLIDSFDYDKYPSE
jgi:hypothetical protein